MYIRRKRVEIERPTEHHEIKILSYCKYKNLHHGGVLDLLAIEKHNHTYYNNL